MKSLIIDKSTPVMFEISIDNGYLCIDLKSVPKLLSKRFKNLRLKQSTTSKGAGCSGTIPIAHEKIKKKITHFPIEFEVMDDKDLIAKIFIDDAGILNIFEVKQLIIDDSAPVKFNLYIVNNLIDGENQGSFLHLYLTPDSKSLSTQPKKLRLEQSTPGVGAGGPRITDISSDNTRVKIDHMPAEFEVMNEKDTLLAKIFVDDAGNLSIHPTDVSSLLVDRTIKNPATLNLDRLHQAEFDIKKTGDKQFEFNLLKGKDESLQDLIFSNLSLCKTSPPLPDGTSVEHALALDNKRKFTINFDSDEIYTFKFNQHIVASLYLDNGDLILKQTELQQINPSELRLSVASALPPPTEDRLKKSEIALPRTDLHTHFAGIMTADTLINAIKLKLSWGKKVLFPIKLLLDAGFNMENLRLYAPDDDRTLDITNLFKAYDAEPKNPIHSTNIQRLKNVLHIPANKTIIFNDMEKYYEYRDPLIKDITLLPFFLKAIANDYREQGINYAEISFSKVIDPAWLKIIEEVIPQIEEESIKLDKPLQIRFLGIIARTAAYEKRKSQIKLFQMIACTSPYVLGIDVLAAEINSTYDMFPELNDLCLWAQVYYPGMIVRIHAGETSYHPENIAGVIQLAKSYPDLQFRIGHGIYGTHSDVLSQLKSCKNIITEINMASNITLNMKLDVNSHTLFEYVRHGAEIVLGSDGHGLYQSVPTDLLKLLTYSSEINLEKFKVKLEKTEIRHMQYINAIFIERLFLIILNYYKSLEGSEKRKIQTLLLSKSLDELYKDLKMGTPVHPSKIAIKHPNGLYELQPYADIISFAYNQLRKTPEFNSFLDARFSGYEDLKAECDAQDERLSQQKRDLIEVTKSQLVSLEGITLTIDKVHKSGGYARTEPSWHGKTPIMISGMLAQDELALLPESISMIKTILELAHPEQFYFVTTGTDFGIQKIVHEMIYTHNKEYPGKPFQLVAYVANNIKTHMLDEYLSDVVLLEDVTSFYNLFEYIQQQVQETGLKLICIGGGMWNRDLIQVVHNELVDMNVASPEQQLILYVNAKGASQDKTKELPKVYARAGFIEIIESIIPSKDVKTHFESILEEIKTAETLPSQGRTTSSTAEEYADKTIKFFNSPSKKMKKLPEDFREFLVDIYRQLLSGNRVAFPEDFRTFLLEAYRQFLTASDEMLSADDISMAPDIGEAPDLSQAAHSSEAAYSSEEEDAIDGDEIRRELRIDPRFRLQYMSQLTDVIKQLVDQFNFISEDITARDAKPLSKS